MKILLSAYACKPNQGSEKGNGWNWAWHLAKEGHEVWVLTLVDNQQAIEQQLALQPMPNLHFIYIAIPEWIKRYVKKIPLPILASFGGQIKYLGWQQRAYKIAQQLDKDHDFDIIHHVTWGSITAGSELWRLNKPFIFGPVGGGQVAPPAFKEYFQDRWKQEARRSLIFKKLAKYNLISRQTLSQADLVLASNSDTYELARQLGAPRVEVFLDTSLPEDYFPQEELLTRSTSQELRLLWVGRPMLRKGLSLTIESLSRVNPLIRFKMTMVGVSANHNLVKGIREFDLENKVNCKGRVPWLEVRNEYLNNDIFFFTSLRDSFGSQLLEAMAHGLPVITLNHQGARDFVPDRAGIKVPVTNPTETVKALAQAVEYMYNNPEHRVEMGRIGYEFAKTQTWSRKALKMLEYYEELKSLKPQNSNLITKSS